MARKILFLDVDGVLNSRPFLLEESRRRSTISVPGEWDKNAHYAAMLDRSAIKTLNLLFESVPDVEVVLSSSWRHAHTVGVMNKLLTIRGANFQLIDATPLDLEHRGEEITQWMSQNGIEPEDRIVVLDDDTVPGFEVHHVRPSFEIGLTEAHVFVMIGLFLRGE